MTSETPTKTIALQGEETDNPGFSSIRVPDLVELVERQLLQAIFEGRLPPGSRIVEAELSRQMGVSRAPLREAARRLESQGVIVSTPRKGFTVRTFSPKEIQDLFQVRLGLEVMAARLACEVATDAQLASLKAYADDMLERAPTLSNIERVTMDLGMHTAISRLSGNEYLQRIFANMQAEIRICQGFIERQYRDPVFIAQSHFPVVDAILRRDADAAEKALRVHLVDAQDKAHAQVLHGDQAPDAGAAAAPATAAKAKPGATASPVSSSRRKPPRP
ncbi:DNA-binding GntR family transcriptional regulator [Comamonas sp. BIGb0152]|uniref:GntR family transcriptional regulator n=1 Tax=Comamonas sp. BIGb0152 TaxID=2940601 RepID=UPI002167E8F7|nr:GntR family transcriptional regulator [Comamonas sp. BIGb0152]MCS4292533.1 DNA-binding GntR family transcriptional regulator [Comamonas sp. BIGb0152]